MSSTGDTANSSHRRGVQGAGGDRPRGGRSLSGTSDPVLNTRNAQDSERQRQRERFKKEMFLS